MAVPRPECERTAHLGVSRRGFVRSLAAGTVFPFLSGCLLPDIVDGLRTVALVGVLGNLEIATETGRLQKALRHFQAVGVDGVVLIGNLTANGARTEYERIAEAWRKVFGREAPHAVFVRGDKDQKAWREGCDEALRALGEVRPPPGDVFDIGGFRFGAAYRKARFADVPVAFRAQGKTALTEEIGWLPRASRNLYAGTLGGIELQPGYVPLATMARASQGLLVRAFGSSARVSRLDFSVDGPAGGLPERPELPRGAYAEPVADDWIVPFDRKPDEPTGEAPLFPRGVRLVLIRGFAGPHHEQAYTVRWPVVRTDYGGARAASYILSVHPGETTDAKPVFRSYHRSPNWHQNEAREELSLSTVVYESNLPPLPDATALCFSLTAVSSLGVRSVPLTVTALLSRK